MLISFHQKLFLGSLLGLFLFFNASAQYYRLNYHTTDDNLIFDAKELSNGNIFTCGFSENYTIIKRDGLVQLLTPTLQIIANKTIHLQGKLISIEKLISHQSNGNYILLGAIGDSDNIVNVGYRYLPAIFKIDSALNLISYKVYTFLPNHYLVGVKTIVTDDSTAFFCGDFLDSNLTKQFILKFNSAGDSAAFRFISVNSFSSITFHDCIYNQPTNDYHFAIFANGIGSTSQLLCLDINLNIKYIQPINYDGFLPSIFNRNFSMKKFSDTVFIYAGEYREFTSSVQDEFIAKVNLVTDSFISYKHYGKSNAPEISADFRSVDFKYKNNIYLGGTSNFGSLYLSPNSSIMINNLDSNLNKRWQRFIGGDAEYLLATVTATQDGGCLLNATRYDTLVNNILYQHDVVLIKLDSLGTVTGVSNNSKIKVFNYYLYPNPSQENIHVHGAISKAIQFKLFDIMGKEIISQTIKSNDEKIAVEKLSAGIYTYQIIESTGKVETGKWVKE